MARTLALTRYPLLKFLLPLGIVLFGVGLVLFLAQPGTEQDPGEKDPGVLLPWAIAGAVAALASVAWRRKEKVTVLLPSDRLHEASRKDLEGILETLEKQRDRGELSPERYTKARNKVLREMEQGK